MGLKTKQLLPDSLLSTQILKEDSSEISVKEVLNNEASLLVLVRHFGCIGCTEQMLAISPRIQELSDLGIKVKVIGNGQAQYIEGFKEKFGLFEKPVEIYTDPTLKIYQEAQMHRKFFKVVNPKLIIEYIRAWRKGIGQKSIEGDNFQLGGMLLVNPEYKLEYYFQNNSVAGIADTNEVMNQVHKYVLRQNSDLI